VLRVIDLRGRRTAGERLDYAAIVPRADFDVAAAADIVRPICSDVARRGAGALADYSMRFDRVVPTSFRVPRGCILIFGKPSQRRSSDVAGSARPSLAIPAAK
jgi:histidinol dehydrogenase